jgi:putative flippase GtrA
MVVRFYIVFVLNLLANVSVNWLFYSLLQTKVIPFILATAAGMAVNFLGQKYFVFYKRSSAGTGKAQGESL